MRYLQLVAAGHALAIEADRVLRVGGDGRGHAVIDLCLRLGAAEPGQMRVACLDGPDLLVGSVGLLVEADAVTLAPWLPEPASMLLDGLVGRAWHVRQNPA